MTTSGASPEVPTPLSDEGIGLFALDYEQERIRGYSSGATTENSVFVSDVGSLLEHARSVEHRMTQFDAWMDEECSRAIGSMAHGDAQRHRAAFGVVRSHLVGLGLLPEREDHDSREVNICPKPRS